MMTSGQARILELEKRARLFENLGKHLVMLGELVEQELSGMSAPQDVHVDHDDFTQPRTRPQVNLQPPTCSLPWFPMSTTDPSPFESRPRSPAKKNLGLASVLHAAQASNFKHKAAGFDSSDMRCSGLGATLEVSSPAFVEPQGDFPRPRVAFNEVPPLPAAGPPGLLVSDGSSEAAPRATIVNVPTDGKLAQNSSVAQHPLRRPVKQKTSLFNSSSDGRRSHTSITNKVIEELQQNVPSDYESNCSGATGMRGKVQYVLSDCRFEFALGTAVMANACFLGLQVDEAVQHSREIAGYRILDTVFASIFFIELCLRIFSERSEFLDRGNLNVTWNAFDSAVILVSVIEEFLKIANAGFGMFASVSVLRLLRVLRVVRVLRTLRLLRYFRDLRVMILGIFGSMKALTWAIALLMLLMYLTAVLIVDTLSDDGEKTMQSEAALEMFGSVMTAMYTLFKSILGGLDWGDAAQPLYDLSMPLGLAYSLYVAFSILCVLNIVTGVFVENSNRMLAKTDEEVLVERLQMRQRHLDQAKTVVGKHHDSNTVQKDDFENLIRNIEFQAVLRKLDVQIDPINARGLFNVIDFDGSGIIQVDDLLARIDQFHGTAKSIDIMRLMHVHKTLLSQVQQLSGPSRSAVAGVLEEERINISSNTWEGERVKRNSIAVRLS